MKIKILMADTDERYLIPLAKKFIDALGDRAEINMITDPAYLKQFFSSLQSLDILLINEELFEKDLGKHNINSMFILSEKPIGDSSTGNLDSTHIYKYTSVGEIFTEVISNLSSSINSCLSYQEDTRVIMVYSPIGGIGVTTVAAALCAALTAKHKRTLFIGADCLQSFGWILKQPCYLNGSMGKMLVSQSEYLYEGLKPHIASEAFDIVPPFKNALSSLNIKSEHMIHLIQSIKASKDYDFIVLSSSNDLSEETAGYLGCSDNALIVCGQDRISAYKLNCLLHNIDHTQSRYRFVCNRYKRSLDNVLTEKEYLSLIHVSEYIDYDEAIPLADIDYLSKFKSLQKIAMMYIS